MKCKIPSFVSDFVEIVNWQDNEDKIFYPNKDYGNPCGLIVPRALSCGIENLFYSKICVLTQCSKISNYRKNVLYDSKKVHTL